MSRSSPKARWICWAMRGQPKRGLRFLISTMALMTSLVGPFGPDLRPSLREYSRRYFHLFIALWNDSRVDGFMMIAVLAIRRGVRNNKSSPRTILSGVVKFGARRRDRLWMISCSLSSGFSTMTERPPPGLIILAREVSRSRIRKM